MPDEITNAPSTSTETTPTEETVTSSTPATTATVETNPEVSSEKEPAVDPSTMKSKDIAELIRLQREKELSDKKTETTKEEEWFDKDRGFKTKEDFVKSYSEAQNKIRETSEQLKQFEEFKAQAETQLAELAKKAENAPLSPEDAQRKEAITKWQAENKESLDFIKNLVKEDLKKETVKEQIQTSAITERNNWKQEFDKDEARKTLWPKMEEIYAKKGNRIFQEFVHNPFPYLEALAFKENFSSIAQKIKQEAIESYKAEMKQAAEVAKSKSTAIPGGVKSLAGEIDVSKMSSSEIAALLARGE